MRVHESWRKNLRRYMPLLSHVSHAALFTANLVFETQCSSAPNPECPRGGGPEFTIHNTWPEFTMDEREPSPPPPPWPHPPEPSPPSPTRQFVLGSLLSGEQVFDLGDLEVHRGSTNGPDVLLHSIVSMMSAIVMLVLACSLRVQAQPRRRAHVANAYPVMLAYGMVPTSEMTIAVSDDVGEVGIPISVGQRIDLIMQPIAPVVDAQESFEESPSVAPERVPNPTEHERRQEG